MTDTRWHRIGLTIGIGLALAILYGSLMHNPPTPEVNNGDKLMHLAGYGLLAGWWGMLLPQHTGRVWLGSALFGVLIECLQGMTSYRSFDVYDMLANAMGALLGLLAGWLLRQGLRRYRQRRG